jgi:single stranded DNA-binding protein
MFFQVQALGQVEQGPELHVVEDGKSSVTEFSLAVNTRRCVEDITIWLNCYAWGEMAETVKRNVTKGSMIFVQGGFIPHEYTTEEGKQGLSFEVNVEKFSFAGGSQSLENGQQSGMRLDDPYCAY